MERVNVVLEHTTEEFGGEFIHMHFLVENKGWFWGSCDGMWVPPLSSAWSKDWIFLAVFQITAVNSRLNIYRIYCPHCYQNTMVSRPACSDLAYSLNLEN